MQKKYDLLDTVTEHCQLTILVQILVVLKGREVFCKFVHNSGKKLIGIDCGIHVINNSIKTEAVSLPVDFEAIINKIQIFQHYNIFTFRKKQK